MVDPQFLLFKPKTDMNKDLFQLAKNFAEKSIADIEKNGIPPFIFPRTQRAFDTLLGDKACQIRVYMYCIIINKIKNKADLTENEIICLGLCQLLSFNQEKEFDEFGMSVKLNTKSGHVPNCTFSNKKRQELVNLARQTLVEKALQYLQNASMDDELSITYSLKRKSGEVLTLIPCFLSTKAILELSKKNHFGLLISVIHFKNEYEEVCYQKEEVLFYQVENNKFLKKSFLEEEQQHVAVMRFHGFTLDDFHLFDDNVFSLEDIILACAADHQQLPDNSFSEINFSKDSKVLFDHYSSLSQKENINSNSYMEKTEKGYERSAKKTAFCIQHVFVDTYANAQMEMLERKELMMRKINCYSKMEEGK